MTDLLNWTLPFGLNNLDDALLAGLLGVLFDGSLGLLLVENVE